MHDYYLLLLQVVPSYTTLSPTPAQLLSHLSILTHQSIFTHYYFMLLKVVPSYTTHDAKRLLQGDERGVLEALTRKLELAACPG